MSDTGDRREEIQEAIDAGNGAIGGAYLTGQVLK